MTKTKVLRPICRNCSERVRIVVPLDEFQRVNRAPEGLALCIKDVSDNFWELRRIFNHEQGSPDTEFLAKR